MSKPFRTRFAPSPTGFLHLGHGYSALLAYRAALKNRGAFLLRIEDIDTTRCRKEFETAIYRDLAWLGLEWPTPARRQSDHFTDYRKALDVLAGLGVAYPCFCTRAEIRKEVKRSQSAPHGPEGALYPGTCRGLMEKAISRKTAAGVPFALRLDVKKAIDLAGKSLTFNEKGVEIPARPETLGDIVLARKDTPTCYHLSVVVDDAGQGVNHVIRGEDLLHATHIHRLLQALLGLPSPRYFHHRLLTGKEGERFAKREKSLTLQSLQEAGKTPGEVVQMIEAFGGSFQELPF